jgi:hypothetical protein
VCVCVRARARVCMYVCIMYVCMYGCMYVCMYVCECIGLRMYVLCTVVCMCVCMDVCMYLCMYICRGMTPIMGRFPDMGRCIISYQEVLHSVLKNINDKQMKLFVVITVQTVSCSGLRY